MSAVECKSRPLFRFAAAALKTTQYSGVSVQQQRPDTCSFLKAYAASQKEGPEILGLPTTVIYTPCCGGKDVAFSYVVIRNDQVEKRLRLSHHEAHEGQARKMSRPIFVSFILLSENFLFFMYDF